MLWQHVQKADDLSRLMADRHYSRQQPGSVLFTPPGRTFVLRCQGAYWVTSWPEAEWVRHRWAGNWICSAYHREESNPQRASDAIRDAVAATRWYHRHGGNGKWMMEPEPELMLTFVDQHKIKHKRDPGRCFLKAGFEPDGTTDDGSLIALVLHRDAMPEPQAPLPMSVLSTLSKGQLARAIRRQT